MAWKSFSDSAYSSYSSNRTDSSGSSERGRRSFLPEIFGIIQGMASALIFMALISGHRGDQMIGAAGDWIHNNFEFVFGQYVVYVIPVMLAINAIAGIFGRRAHIEQYRSLIRGFGGLILMIATCGFMAMIARVNDPEDAVGIFNNGGVVGSFLVDYEGLHLSRYLGRVGAFVVLGGAALIGLVLFTERFIRDFGIFLLKTLAFIFLPGRLFEKLGDMASGFTQFFNGSWIHVIRRFVGGIQFRPDAPRRVLASSTILGIAPATDREISRRLAIPRIESPPGMEDYRDHDDYDDQDDYDEPEAEGEVYEDEPAPPPVAQRWAAESARNGRVFGTAPARGVIEEPPIEDDEEEESEEEEITEGKAESFESDDSAEEFEQEEDEEEEEAVSDRVIEYEDDAEDEVEEAVTDAPTFEDSRRASDKADLEELFGAALRKATERPTPAPTVKPVAKAFADSAPVTEVSSTPVNKGTARVFRINRPSKPDDAEVEPEQQEIPFERNFALPSLDLLQEPPPATYRMSQEEANDLSRRIEQTLAQFKIEVEVFEVVQGPTVTRFAMSIAPGIRVNKILALENDLALALKAQQIRILAPIPGQAAVGIEVPNKKTNGVFLRDLLSTEAYQKSRSPLSFALGMNISGDPVIADLAQMPHLLIAGATGSGKSVCLNTIIASMLFRNSPDKVKFVMIDPKRVELAVYQAIPHLIAPVVCEPKKAAAALAWTVEQMDERYKICAELGVRNIDGYNAIVQDKQPNRKAMGRNLKYMPHIVVVIDELADLMMVARNEVEEYIIRLAQLARAVGIHLILATQRPSVNVITGIIKANFPSRIAFRVSSKVDSRTILDMNGAQALLGKGDMLYSPGGVKPFRIQGAYVSDEEIERVADYIRAQEKVRYEKEDFGTDQAAAAQKAKAQLVMQIAENSSVGTGEENENLEASDSVDGSEAPTLVRPDGIGGARPIMGGSRADAYAAASRSNSVYLPPADLDSLSDEEIFDIALKLVLESKKASVSYIQRRLKIGYARAGRLMDMMEERGIVGPYQGSKPRDLLVDPDEFRRRMAEAET